MKKILAMVAVALMTVIQGARAWDGSGTVTDPYLIKTSDDWKRLASDVVGGNTFSGQFFTMTADIDAQGISIGSIGARFMGTFDGGGHTLTYNRGSEDNYVDDYCSPFVFTEAATIRHLNVTGRVYTSRMYAAGIVSSIESTAGPTIIDDCHVSTHMRGASNLDGDASMGGLIGLVQDVGPHTNGPIIRNCSFTGSFGRQGGLGGLVSYTNIPVTFEHCMYDGEPCGQGNALATYVRTPDNMICPMTECYYTNALGLAQGEGVFRECVVPEGCSYRFVSEPNAFFNGVEYYKSGAVIELTAPDDVPFNHWESDAYGCWFSDPWQRSGTQTLRDINHTPTFHINPTALEAKMEREMDGTLYRYLYRHDYHLYISDEEIAQKSYHFDSDGELFKWDADGNHVWITAVVGWKSGSIPSDGAQIHNDLSGWFRDHTFMGVIAPHAFDGCTELKTLYFKDTDANNYNASAGFDFIIGDKAFANCPNLTEVKMMQYTTKGDNHWEALSPGQVTRIGKGVFSGSPQANFSTDITEYQNYLSSETWKDYQTRIIVYNHTNVDFTTNGSRYSYMRNTKGEPLKNDNDGHTALMPTLQTWNADYQDFTAVDLLAPQDDKNIWYAYIVGCDDDYLKSNDGTLRVYNDPGSYYNYKTLAVGRNAFKDSKELKKIEFWQTNGRSENSYTDLKMVIQNGAFKGCSNLQELRMFYYVQDGDDHWETLGPKDVIPGDNIFGLPTADETEGMSAEELSKQYLEAIPQGFKIVVSPDRYQEFLDDPNWVNYQSYIEPEEFNPNNSDTKDFSLGGLTYGYMTSPGGIMQTSQTVSQDVSWWTAPRIAVEVVIMAATAGSAYSPISAAKKKAAELALEAEALHALNAQINTAATTVAGSQFLTLEESVKKLMETTATNYGRQIFAANAKNMFLQPLTRIGLVTQQGVWASQETMVKLLLSYGVNEVEDNLFKLGIATYAKLAAQHTVSNAIPQVLAQGTTNALTNLAIGNAIAGSVTTASYLASKYWGGSGSYNGDLLQKGMRANILSNMHQVGLVGGGYVITTPQKNLCYHTYIKDVPASTTDAVIYAGTGKGQGRNNNARTMTMAKNAFRGHTNLKTVKFHETGVQSDEAHPMLFTIPDSAFVGCTNLERFDLRVETENNGQQALGPESFIF
ncbi:MAG: leucine-rich repeat protein, partial [Prevotella sp.]|nr:leucine-rich repeat protein [Prevotella sp.]